MEVNCEVVALAAHGHGMTPSPLSPSANSGPNPARPLLLSILAHFCFVLIISQHHHAIDRKLDQRKHCRQEEIFTIATLANKGEFPRHSARHSLTLEMVAQRSNSRCYRLPRQACGTKENKKHERSVCSARNRKEHFSTAS